MSDTIGLRGCEHCGKEVPLEDALRMEDCYYCAECYAAWKAEFDACEHDWEPHINGMGDPGQYCPKCMGFVADEDMPALIAPTPSP